MEYFEQEEKRAKIAAAEAQADELIDCDLVVPPQTIEPVQRPCNVIEGFFSSSSMSISELPKPLSIPNNKGKPSLLSRLALSLLVTVASTNRPHKEWLYTSPSPEQTTWPQHHVGRVQQKKQVKSPVKALGTTQRSTSGLYRLLLL